ncbi:ComEA family DNA-binding protein [Paenibacillus shirakamiensis]|nr:helix-hairpin-helix domain-containing protein [Paenibacillus shirakamiensis]
MEAGIAPSGSVAGAKSSSKDQPATLIEKKIHINSATVQDLMNIPGIGAKKAAAILAYREQHGAFKSINELTEVKGIGNKMLEKMRPYIGL